MITESDVFQIFTERRSEFQALAYRFLGNAHDAEDCVTDALIGAVKQCGNFRQEASLFAWAKSIVRLTAYTQFNKRRRAFSIDQVTVAVPASQERSLILKETSMRLKCAIGRLPLRQRNAVVSETCKGHRHSSIRHHGILALRRMLA